MRGLLCDISCDLKTLAREVLLEEVFHNPFRDLCLIDVILIHTVSSVLVLFGKLHTLIILVRTREFVGRTGRYWTIDVIDCKAECTRRSVRRRWSPLSFG